MEGQAQGLAQDLVILQQEVNQVVELHHLEALLVLGVELREAIRTTSASCAKTTKA